MGRKIQLGALIVGMLLVGAQRFTASASAAVPAEPQGSAWEGGFPMPPPR
jgi:hypothetical protein